jgi:hypothetical protein
MATRKIVNKHINQSSSTYVGVDGELFYDTETNTLKISDGTTPGGTTLTTDGAGTAYTPIVSIIRAQRTAGGNANEVGRWTLTTLSGTATATAQSLGDLKLVFTLTGFTQLPSCAIEMETLYSPAAPDDVTDNFIGSVQDFGSPNCITTFTPDTHKIHITKATTQAVDWYFIIKQ